MKWNTLRNVWFSLFALGSVSTLLGIFTGVTLGCTVVGCSPSAPTGFQGIGIEGYALVYYQGCNACTISPFISVGALLLFAGLVVLVGRYSLPKLSAIQST